MSLKKIKYLLPIEPADLSTLCGSDFSFSCFVISRILGSKSGLFEIGKIEHLYGATEGGIVKYRLSASFSRVEYVCSFFGG